MLHDFVTQKEVSTPQQPLALKTIGQAEVSAGVDCPDIRRADPGLVDQVVDELIILAPELNQLEPVIVCFHFIDSDKVVVVPILFQVKHKLGMELADGVQRILLQILLGEFHSLVDHVEREVERV